MKSAYDKAFYDSNEAESLQSARMTVPYITRFVEPMSVVDVGCGLGTWLRAFEECGVRDVVGIDGEYVDLKRLLIQPEIFVCMNLEQPQKIGRTFDLAMSLEVAEHLSPEAADGFVEFMTELSPVVLFSAAIPNQGGHCHVNEQWPSYWAALFLQRGYLAVDALRPLIWQSQGIEPWYTQNAFFYVREEMLDNYESLRKEWAHTDAKMFDLVHPELYERVVTLQYTPARRLIQELTHRVMRRILGKV